MYQFSIQESAPIGTAVGRVKAEDSDVGENTDMTYQLKDESGGSGSVFKVTTDSDTQEAIIVVQKVRLLPDGRDGWRWPGQQGQGGTKRSKALTSLPTGMSHLQRPRADPRRH